MSSTVADVESGLLDGQTKYLRWKSKHMRAFFAPEIAAAAGQLLASLPPQVVSELAKLNPKAFEEVVMKMAQGKGV